MKKTVLMLTVAASLFACNSKKTSLESDKNIVLTDTSALNKSNLLTDTAAAGEAKRVAAAGTAAPKPVKKPTGNNGTKTNNGSTAGADNTRTPASTTNAPAPAPANQDKGWSKAAQGTVVGAASGAVIGAVVSKDKAKGAVIGAVIGGGGGYVLGRSKDRKSGRVARKRAVRDSN